MKNLSKLIGIIAFVAVIGFSFAACDDGGDPTPQTVTYSGTANGITYTLKITENTARYAAQIGDAYELSVGAKKSTGTVENVSGGNLTLKPSNAEATFTASVSNGGISGFTGSITFDGDTTPTALPSEVTPQPPTPPVQSGGPKVTGAQVYTYDYDDDEYTAFAGTGTAMDVKCFIIGFSDDSSYDLGTIGTISGDGKLTLELPSTIADDKLFPVPNEYGGNGKVGMVHLDVSDGAYRVVLKNDSGGVFIEYFDSAINVMGLSVKKGWNYFHARENDFTIISDISNFKWVFEEWGGGNGGGGGLTNGSMTVSNIPQEYVGSSYRLYASGGTPGVGDNSGRVWSGAAQGNTMTTTPITGTTVVLPLNWLSGTTGNETLAVHIYITTDTSININSSGVPNNIIQSKQLTLTFSGRSASVDWGGGNPGNPATSITYTATQTGGTDGTANTTGIAFTFSASVTGLTADHISVTSGNGPVTKGALSGSGASWTLGVTVITAGNVTVAIAKSGIEAEAKDVTVYKAGETAPTLTGIAAVYTQGSTIVYPTTPLNDLTGLTVKAQYTGGSEITLSNNEYTLSGTLTVGTSTITVTYEDEETTFTVTVTPAVKTLTGITLNASAVEKSYTQNETLDLTGQRRVPDTKIL